MQKRYVGLLYISPWLIGFMIFQLYPFITSFLYSFTKYDLISPPKFIGLDNYIRAFTDDEVFVKSLKTTISYVFMVVPSKIVVSLFIAMLLNLNLRYIGIFRTIYYLPSILGGSVAVSIIWRFLFIKEGVVNLILTKLSLPAIDWLGSPILALPTISSLAVWQFGSSMVLFLAGLKQIPKDLYEAGTMDGASKANMFFNITLPMLTPILFFNIIMQTINAFQEFTAAFVITNGGPLKSTYMFGMMLYEQGFSLFKMGYASALSWILFAIILIFTLVYFSLSKKWVHYEDGGKF